MTSFRIFICYLCALIFIACSSTSSSISSFDNLSQTTNNDAFQITVSGDGPTKDQAVQSALRNAIEQSYGTFLSSNTKFLNDKLIKDEITSVAQGNILGYDLVSISESKQGVTAFVKAQVSLTKLAQFGQSKGQSVSVNSNVVYMNAKKEDFYEKNEYQIVLDYIESFKYIPLVDYKLDVKNPVRCSETIRYKWFYYHACRNSAKNTWVYPIEIEIIANENYKEFYFGLISLLESISIDEKTRDFRLESGLYVGPLKLVDNVREPGRLNIALLGSYNWHDDKLRHTYFSLRNEKTLEKLQQGKFYYGKYPTEKRLFGDVRHTIFVDSSFLYNSKNSHINDFVKNKVFFGYNLYFKKQNKQFSLKPRTTFILSENSVQFRRSLHPSSDFSLNGVVNDLSCLIDKNCTPKFASFVTFNENLFKDVTGFEIRPKY